MLKTPGASGELREAFPRGLRTPGRPYTPAPGYLPRPPKGSGVGAAPRLPPRPRGCGAHRPTSAGHLRAALTPTDPEIPALQVRHSNRAPEASGPFPPRAATARGPPPGVQPAPLQADDQVDSARKQPQGDKIPAEEINTRAGALALQRRGPSPGPGNCAGAHEPPPRHGRPHACANRNDRRKVSITHARGLHSPPPRSAGKLESPTAALSRRMRRLCFPFPLTPQRRYLTERPRGSPRRTREAVFPAPPHPPSSLTLRLRGPPLRF